MQQNQHSYPGRSSPLVSSDQAPPRTTVEHLNKLNRSVEYSALNAFPRIEMKRNTSLTTVSRVTRQMQKLLDPYVQIIHKSISEQQQMKQYQKLNEQKMEIRGQTQKIESRPSTGKTVRFKA